MIKPIIFVPKTADLKAYNLSELHARRLLDELEGDCEEIAPGTGIYMVSSLNKVDYAFHSLTVKE